MKTTLGQIKRVVVLGTGTDVGKTYVGVGLVKALRARGREVLALKPVESGVAHLAEMDRREAASQHAAPGTAAPRERGDAAALQRAASKGAVPLYALRDPISPHLAARREGLTIDLGELLRWVESQEQEFVRRSSSTAVSLIETAGGCFSPLSESYNNFDWALALQPAIWVLVAPDCLGVLHDIQATLRALSPRYPELLVLSAARTADASTGTNASEIEAVVYPQLMRSSRPSRALPQVVTVPRQGELSDLACRIDAMVSCGRAVTSTTKQ